MFMRCMLLGTLLCTTPLFAVDEPADARDQPKTKPPELNEPAARDTFLLVPLRVYRLRSETFNAGDCKLEDRDFERILGKVNRVWAVAGVTFGLERICEEQANTAALERLHRLQKLTDNTLEELGATQPIEDAEAPNAWLAERNSRLFKALIPEHTREFTGFRVYYIHAFDVNGIYYGQREAMVKATARLSPVPGGIDEPLPRVTAHELGHGLGLPHRQDRVNLMASGTTGTSFIEDEIKQARAIALKVPGVLRYSELSERIAREENAEQKALLERWKQAVEAQTPSP